jgi:hypothetical protein
VAADEITIVDICEVPKHIVSPVELIVPDEKFGLTVTVHVPVDNAGLGLHVASLAYLL